VSQLSSSLHRVRAPLAVAGARLRSQPLRSALLVGGVALAFAMLVSVLGGSLVARQQALARALGGLPATERGFRVDRFGPPLDGPAYAQADRRARRAMAELGGGATRRVILVRELRVQGELIELAAVDDLAQAVRLRSGRLPRSCLSSGCEVLQLGGGGAPRLAQAGLRLRRVGIAQLRDPALFGDVSAATGGGASPPTLLLAPSVGALQRLEALALFYRVYSWVSPLRVDRLHTWDVRRILAAESRAQSALAADAAFRLSGPDAALLDASSRGRIAAERLVLVGGETSALLLGFAIIAAIGLRRGLASERRRLRARGARRWQVTLAPGAEIGAMTLAGGLAGLAIGAAVTSAIADAAGLPVGQILAHALLAGVTLAALAGAWVVTTLLLVAATFSSDDGEGGRRRVRLVDVAAVGAAAAIAVGLSRGALDPQSVSSGSTVLLVLPVLVCFVAAVVFGRLLGPAMRATERLTRNGSVSLRLAVLALARAPSRTVVSCAFIAVALGLALFAATYRATLTRGAVDQAGFEVPLDFTLSEGSRLVSPLDAAPLARYRRIGGGARAYPVLRLSATTAGSGSTVLSPTVLGVPADAIRRLRWRSDYSALPPRTIASRLGRGGVPRLAGVGVDATRLTVAARLRGRKVVVGLVVGGDRGRVRVLTLRPLRRGSTLLSTRLRPGAQLHVLGIQLALAANEQFFLAHRETESNVSTVPSGTLELGPLRAGRRTVTGWRGWLFATGGRVTRTRGHVRLAFAFQDTGARLLFRPKEPSDRRLVPAVVSPDIAQAAGGIGSETRLDFQDVAVAARIVGVATRMPTVPSASGPFVLVDGAWLSTAIDAGAPGEGRPNEVWVSAPHDRAVASALRRPPFARLQVASRASIEHRLATDPLAHATELALSAAGVVALAIAVLGFWVGILGELRDERSDFFDLEAQGVPPGRLRAQLRTRAVILVGLGIVGGAGLGALLSRLVVSLVRVSATTATPEPPLRFDPAWLASGLGVLALAVTAALVAEGASLAAFRSERPRRASWSLE
jgi:putative ABC transport system permease protein